MLFAGNALGRAKIRAKANSCMYGNPPPGGSNVRGAGADITKGIINLEKTLSALIQSVRIDAERLFFLFARRTTRWGGALLFCLQKEV